MQITVYVLQRKKGRKTGSARSRLFPRPVAARKKGMSVKKTLRKKKDLFIVMKAEEKEGGEGDRPHYSLGQVVKKGKRGGSLLK